jgi:hypothetical protein
LKVEVEAQQLAVLDKGVKIDLTLLLVGGANVVATDSESVVQKVAE